MANTAQAILTAQPSKTPTNEAIHNLSIQNKPPNSHQSNSNNIERATTTAKNSTEQLFTPKNLGAPKEYTPPSALNVTIIPNCKLAGPVIIKINDKTIKNTTQFNNQIDYAYKNYKIVKIHDDSKGDLIVVPVHEADADKLVNDNKFFNGFEKRNLAREAHTVVINNMTLSEIEDDDELIDELLKLGVIDVCKLTPSQASYTKLVKAYCENEQTKKKLENSNIKIRTVSGRDLLIVTSPNVPPPIQCGTCWDYGHETCKKISICSNCDQQGHKHSNTRPCRSNALCINCKKQHNARQRGICDYYHNFRKNQIRTATGRSKNTQDTESFSKICSFQSDLDKVNQNISQIKQDNHGVINDLINENKAANNELKELIIKMSSDITTKVTENIKKDIKSQLEVVKTEMTTETTSRLNKLREELKNFMSENFICKPETYMNSTNKDSSSATNA